MVMKVVFPDGNWFIGRRGLKELIDETPGCHHFTVLDGSGPFYNVTCEEIAVQVSKPLFFILNYKRAK